MSQDDANTLPRVLIVDDSRMVRATIAKHVKDVFDVREEADGEAGWEALSNDPTIQVVLSDIGMPKLDGYGLLERIRASTSPRIRDIPVVIISGNQDQEGRNRAAMLGATDYITKGIGTIELRARLEALIQLSQATRKLDDRRDEKALAGASDPVTGLGNKEFLFFQGRQLLSYARRHNTHAAVLILHFEKLAEFSVQYGKAAVDQLMSLFAKQLTAKKRTEDAIARTGEHEFSLVCPGTSPEASVAFAARLRDAIAAIKIKLRGEPVMVDASIGIANSGFGEMETIEALHAMAERDVKQALSAGGNRLVSAGQEVARKPASATAPSVRPGDPRQPAPAAPDIERAIALIAAGQTQDLAQHARALLLRMLPLLNYCASELDLDALSMQEIKNRLSPN